MRTVFTIDYEQATQAAVVAALCEAGVAVLADIRFLPLSRRRRIAPGLRKLRTKSLENPWKNHDNIPL